MIEASKHHTEDSHHDGTSISGEDRHGHKWQGAWVSVETRFRGRLITCNPEECSPLLPIPRHKDHKREEPIAWAAKREKNPDLTKIASSVLRPSSTLLMFGAA